MYDPALLEDPEWQIALRAASSPQPRRPREKRESPSSRPGAQMGEEDLWVADPMPTTAHSILDVDHYNRREENGQGAARTSSQVKTETREKQATGRARADSTPLTYIVDSDDEICIVEPASANILRISREQAPENQPRPTNLNSNNNGGANHRQTRSSAATIDRDLELALQLQRELDGEVNEIVDVEERDESPPPALARNNTPLASSIPRHRAPEGPARGSFGVITRHGYQQLSQSARDAERRPQQENFFRPRTQTPKNGIRSLNTSSSTAPSEGSSQRPTTRHSFAARSAQPGPQEERSLPPVNRNRSAPIGPAHAPPQYGNSNARSRSDLSNASFSLSSSSSAALPPRREQSSLFLQDLDNYDLDGQLEDMDALITIDGSDDDDDDDERRLRSGVSTARIVPQRNEPARRQHHNLTPEEIYQLVNHRPMHGPGSRRDLMQQDEEIANFLMRENARQFARGGRGRGAFRGHGGRGGGHFGEFEVDTSDYEAMSRLAPVTRGASAGLVSRLPEVKSSHDDCTICQGTAETAMITLPCFHNFHKECITPHFKTSRLCPNCRHEAE